MLSKRFVYLFAFISLLIIISLFYLFIFTNSEALQFSPHNEEKIIDSNRSEQKIAPPRADVNHTNIHSNLQNIQTKACQSPTPLLLQSELKSLIENIKRDSTIEDHSLWKNYHLKNTTGKSITLRVTKDDTTNINADRVVFQLYEEDETGFPWPQELSEDARVYSDLKLKNYLSENTLLHTQDTRQLMNNELELIYQIEQQAQEEVSADTELSEIKEWKLTYANRYTECQLNESQWQCFCSP